MPSIRCRILQMNFLYVCSSSWGGRAPWLSAMAYKNVDVLSFMSYDAVYETLGVDGNPCVTFVSSAHTKILTRKTSPGEERENMRVERGAEKIQYSRYLLSFVADMR